ncbi:phosphatidylinositol N-acetylglucosaminyltransferase subunit H [Protopterus annectens]|uniref:phosphatidylinositol N-acetylglucosaminyltransferase subunit H n=1 Tax=Protopterus annectens TaxID=7888 RepID=UPI001CFB8E3F|nr:phosphatidylinositol N-acetylglucosaminyltransferase subunit H [Protopterus annectens]
MEDKSTFTNVYGNKISLKCESHSALCQEFTVTSPKLSLHSVTTCTCIVWVFAYAVFYCTQNTGVLSAAIILTVVGLMVYLHFMKIDEESLLIIGSLGIQMTASYASGRESTTFIEMNQVKDIVINEVIHMQQVIYQLCLLLRDASDPNGVSAVVPVFQSSKPRLNCLVKVYRNCQDILTLKDMSEIQEGCSS